MIAFFDSLLQHDQNHNQSSGENSDDDESIVNLRSLWKNQLRVSIMLYPFLSAS